MKHLLIVLSLAFSTIGKAQVSDQFTDGDFTQNPTWTGDVGEFEVNTLHQLHLLWTGIDTSMLATANTQINDAEWDFWFRVSFAPSDNNYLRMYLVSNQSNLKNSLNGYFLRYGENGSADGIDLWKQTGNTLVKIIDGTPNPNAAATNQLIRVKVVRSATGNWQLSADYTGGYAFQNIGSVTDNTFTNTAYLGVWCKYTATNATAFYFDDIYAGPIIIDNTAPTVLSVNVISADSISVIFSEPITQLSATTLNNYSIAGIGNPSSVTYNSSTPDKVKLVLPISLISEQIYAVDISGIQDYASNTMVAFTGSVSFYVPHLRDIIITEMMVDPTPIVGLPDAEFIEIYNRKNFPIDVTGWKIQVGSTVRTIPAGIIQPDSFLVLSINPLPMAYSAINAVGVPSFTALNNSGATISILSPSNTVINTVTYSSTWYHDAGKADGGWTLELINPNDFCSGANNWTASNDITGGTPGRRNSVNNNQPILFNLLSASTSGATQLDVVFSHLPDFNSILVSAFEVNQGIGNPDSVKLIGNNTVRLYFGNTFAQQTTHQLTVESTVSNCVQQVISGNLSVSFMYYLPTAYDVIITEIMADPTPIVGLPDAEFIEIYNRKNFPIDVTGWKIQVGSTVRTIPSGVIQPDSFLVLSINPLPMVYSAINAVGVPSFTALNNSGATISILSPSNTVINTVTYSSTWYHDAGKADGGWTLELINPNDFCSGANNWIASNDVSGGTPGRRNSVNSNQPVQFHLLFATTHGSSQLDVFFSHLPNLNLLLASAFEVNQGIGNPDSVKSVGNNTVRLYFSNAFTQETSYQLTISNSITNCVQQPISGILSISFMYYLPVAYDIIISEIMADPTPVVGLPDAEFIEIYNRKNFPIHLTGWKIKVGNTIRSIPIGIIPPDSFLVLSINPLPMAYSTINAVAIPSFTTLNNTGATVSILSPDSTIINSVTYALSWYHDAIKDDGGWSLEMINLNDFCNGSANWTSSNDVSGGTPGRRNSVNIHQPAIFSLVSAKASAPKQLDVYFSQQPDLSALSVSSFIVNGGIGIPDSIKAISNTSIKLYFSNAFAQNENYELSVSNTALNCIQQPISGLLSVTFTYYLPKPYDVIITEIMADPDPPIGLPNAEYVELYNKTSFSIDVSGWKIKSGSSMRIIPLGIIPPDSFIVLTIDPLPSLYTVLNAVSIPSFPAISNAGGTVTIYSPTDIIIHQVTYSSTWYRDAVKDDGGWSLEMINPNDICNGANNWIACQNFSGGTPAARNSVHNAQPVNFSIVSATASGISQVDVYFNQFPNSAQLIPTNFSVNQGVGQPDSVKILNGLTCRLYFSAVFSQQEIYELTVGDSFFNCANQSITGNLSVEFTFYTPKQNDIIITEIMADESPSQGLPLYEYVELYNRSSVAIQLGDWQFTAGTVSKSLPVYLMDPGTYLTLTKIEAQSLFSGNVMGISSFPSLTNSSSTLSLRSSSGQQIHSVSYVDSWIRESYKRDGGWSMEMQDFNNPCAGKENWTASIHPDGGTPGMVNSVTTIVSDKSRPRPIRVGALSVDTLLIYFSEPLKISTVFSSQFNITNGVGSPVFAYVERPLLKTVLMKLIQPLQPGMLYTINFSDSVMDCVGNKIEMLFPLHFQMSDFPLGKDVILNEILFDAKGKGEDYVELFNRSSKAIDLKEIYLGDYDSVAKSMTTKKLISSRSAILMAGEYILLSRDKSDIYNNYFTENPNAFWDIPSMPSLSNSGGSIAICDNNYQILDALTFTDKFQFSLLSNVDGVALERINPEAKTQSKYNWTSASASSGYGTPGYKNSQAGMPAEQDDVISLSPEIFSPDQDGYEDILFINYEFPEPGNVITINIYNELGQLMKKLVNNEYCGTKGEYTWDGGTDNNIRPKVGIYVVMAEWYNESGEKGRAKKVVVLGTKL